jgi:AraC-like DNA-binding protein
MLTTPERQQFGTRHLERPAGRRPNRRSLLIAGLDLGRHAALAALLSDDFDVRVTAAGQVAARCLVERRPDMLVVDGRLAEAEVDLVLAATSGELTDRMPVVLTTDHPLQLPRRLDRAPSVRHAFRRDVVDLAITVFDMAPRGRTRLAPLCQSRNVHVRRAVEEVARRYRDRLTVGTLAAATGVSNTYLSHLFKEQTGMTVKAYVGRVHLETAKSLLLDGNDTLDLVADKAGFADASHLSRAFRRHIGATPSEHRRLAVNR